ncbi:IS3 family transposase [Brevibacillus dissolubilis]|uniref:IS3 family transposase n=1 Tax=Brevibacillus dissolubilis TaxID=1844116 RepID=UPI00111791BE|nr:IS3 family transposase [Brevibacillus dissolubilis]
MNSKKVSGILKGSTLTKYRFIQKNPTTYTVKLLCRIFKYYSTRLLHYDWKKRRKSNRAIDLEVLEDGIRDVYKEFKGRYGSPRIALELCKRCIFTSKNRVARLMQRMGLSAVSSRRRNQNGKKPDATRIMKNLVKRAFTTEKKNALWVGDITYIPLQTGFLYLATYIDVFSRKVVGRAISTRMTDQLVIDAFMQAVGKEHSKEGLIVHTGRGSPYTSKR